jgi:hypothetical protein
MNTVKQRYGQMQAPGLLLLDRSILRGVWPVFYWGYLRGKQAPRKEYISSAQAIPCIYPVCTMGLPGSYPGVDRELLWKKVCIKSV